MKRRSLLEKLHDEAVLARLQLEDCVRHAAGTVYPDSLQAARFSCYSEALRRLVARRLEAPGWVVETSDFSEVAAWWWEAEQQQFCFDYCGSVVLVSGGLASRMFLSVKMWLDPEKPLESELGRLADEALFYRKAADRMTCEVGQGPRVHV